jgi:hypothetical protein
VTALTPRDRRALAILGGCAAFSLAVYFWPESGGGAAAGAVQTVPQAEKRLLRLRQLAAAAPGREETVRKLGEELARREQAIIAAATQAQAQAQLLQIVRRVAKGQEPPLELRATEFGPVRPYGPHYGEVSITLTLDCGIEQIVNFLADIGNQPEALATIDVQLGQARDRTKTVAARIAVSALAPRPLVPEQRGGNPF